MKKRGREGNEMCGSGTKDDGVWREKKKNSKSKLKRSRSSRLNR